jgi:hypothetical protein
MTYPCKNTFPLPAGIPCIGYTADFNGVLPTLYLIRLANMPKYDPVDF